jgi:glycosyl transferase family 2
VSKSACDEISARPMFSFLTTAYRTEATVARTIEAVLAQTRTDWEMIIVDNGNSDPMAQAVEPYLSDARIRLIRQENRGASGGIAAAAERAHGRYLVILNSDDSVTADYCQRMGDFLEENPGVGAVTCDAYLFVDPGAVRRRRSYLRSAGLRGRPDGRRSLRLSDVIDGPCPYYTASIRRDVWDSVGGMSTETPVVADLDFWLRTLSAGHDVRMIPDRLGLLRVVPGSVSRPVEPAASEQFEAQLEQVFRCAAERSGTSADTLALERVLRRVRYIQAIRRARLALEHGAAKEAVRCYQTALRERKTVRAAALSVGLRTMPGVLLGIHPVKRRIQAWWGVWLRRVQCRVNLSAEGRRRT